MSFEARFYQNYSKLLNSTYQPPSSFTPWSASIVLKEGCNITTPQIEVKLDSATDCPASWNYCYIPAFNRYYYVRNWRAYRGLWTSELSCDVLASFKAAIGATSQYVLRAYSEKDGSVVDALYPTTSAAYTTTDIVNFYSANPNNWTIVAGIISGSGSGLTGLAYYAFTPDEFNSFTNTLLGTGQNQFIDNFGDVTDIMSVNVARILFNPFDYIAAIWLYPAGSVDPSGISVTRIELGYWNIDLPSGVTPKRISRLELTQAFTTSFNVPRHPQSSQVGEYLNYNAYSTHIVHIPPFDDFELAYPTYNSTYQVSVYIYTDLTSGIAMLMLMSNGKVIATKYANTGMQLQISGVAYNTAPLNLSLGEIPKMAAGALQVGMNAGQAMTNIAGSLPSAVGGDTLGAIGGALASVGAGIAAGIGETFQQINSSAAAAGSGYPSLAKTLDGAELRSMFKYVTERNPSEFGYPLCKTRVLNTLSGFIKCGNAEVHVPGAFQPELEAIEAFLNAGFYYE